MTPEFKRRVLDKAMLAIFKMENRIRDLELINERNIHQGGKLKKIKRENSPIKIEIHLKN